jgi:hypothetical protein
MRRSRALIFVALLAAWPSLATAQSTTPPPSLSVVDPAGRGPSLETTGGSLVHTIPIEVPAFHGIEPRLGLAYSSRAGNGFVGTGWRLTGFSVIERTRTGRGNPRFTSTDVFVLDGQKLLPCAEAAASPGCAAGGTHATKQETYLRIRFDATANSWTIWATNGVTTVFEPVLDAARGTLRWGQSRVINPSGNEVSFAWESRDGEGYPARVTYGPYEVRLVRDPDPRPDVMIQASGAGGLARMRYRLGSIVVARGSAPIRAYRLGYGRSAETGHSLLREVQLFGHDVQIDGEGRIAPAGGTSLPSQTFRYQGTD